MSTLYKSAINPHTEYMDGVWPPAPLPKPEEASDKSPPHPRPQPPPETWVPPFVDRMLMTTEQMAKILHVTRETLATWRTQGKGPPSIRLGRRRFYPVSEFEKWLAAQPAMVRHAKQRPPHDPAEPAA